MEPQIIKTMQNSLEPNIGLIIWQILLFIVLLFIIFILVKLYKKIVQYLDLKITYLKETMKSKDKL